jgi:2-oxo-3-hexenedioate decarboxylase
VLDASSAVVGGIEVIDSRFEAFSFTLPDVIADNTSACRHLVGSTGVSPRSVDLRLLGCVFDVDGVTVSSAAGAALLGDPASCVALLANHVGRLGLVLEAGWPILAGSLTDAVPLVVGRSVVATYAGLGSVALRAA